MFSFIKKIFRGTDHRYDEQKKKLASANVKDREALASSSETLPEILYYLSKDADAGVRRVTATNKATPVQASALLARDPSVDVRVALAARLVDLLPDLSQDEHSQLYAYAVQALRTLAQDEVFRIRQSLASALKDHAKAPPQVVGQLARDVEREVSEPILRFCIALSDDDLLDILSEHPEPWVISAIAERPIVSERVSDAVIETQDVPANKALIANNGARISPDSLQKIIEQAKTLPEWHEPLAARKDLSIDIARQLAGFVSDSVMQVLARRSDFDLAMQKEITDIVTRRFEYKSHHAPGETAESKLDRYLQSGKLTPEVIHDALVWQDHKFVALSLAHLSRIHPVIVQKMLTSGSAKPVIAVCYMARLPMRFAVEMQKTYAKLPPKSIIYAKGGTDYPMSPQEIKWQLEFFGAVSK